jgi:NADH dehydrogenase
MPGESSRILVTGANGHLGRQLITRLAAPQRVRALVRSHRAARVLEELPDAVRPEIRIVGYRSSSDMEKAAKDCRAVVHLVGILKEGRHAKYLDAHEATCIVLASVAEAAGVERIVYLSIVGASPDSSNACLASKGRAERILLEGAVPTVILRVPMVLGPGEIAARALAGQARAKIVPLIRGGATLQQPIDAADVVSAILASLEASDLEDVSLDLAGPECLSQRALLDRAARHLGKRPSVVPLPLFAISAFARLAEKVLSNPPLTRAMLEVLERDDRIDTRAALQRLAIQLTPLDHTLKRCLAAEDPLE